MDKPEEGWLGACEVGRDGRRFYREYVTQDGVTVKVGDDVMAVKDGETDGFELYRLWSMYEMEGRRYATVWPWMRAGDEYTKNWYDQNPKEMLHEKEVLACLDDIVVMDLSKVRQVVVIRSISSANLTIDMDSDYNDPVPTQTIVRACVGAEGGDRAGNPQGWMCCWSCYLKKPNHYFMCRSWDEDSKTAQVAQLACVPEAARLHVECKSAPLRAGQTGFASISMDKDWGERAAEQDKDDALLSDEEQEQDEQEQEQEQEDDVSKCQDEQEDQSVHPGPENLTEVINAMSTKTLEPDPELEPEPSFASQQEHVDTEADLRKIFEDVVDPTAAEVAILSRIMPILNLDVIIPEAVAPVEEPTPLRDVPCRSQQSTQDAPVITTYMPTIPQNSTMRAYTAQLFSLNQYVSWHMPAILQQSGEPRVVVPRKRKRDQ
eukprot:TRINITY_DN15612_c0_g2_i1.p1 TRINITY_DN15612_c0_g2~~TRINITY_DN15612_c0_g2_i1.p1  ORF type:complete len:433 (+),score=106.37 TRINITY_DN15612_c0_g2_i1:191-1489(+)